MNYLDELDLLNEKYIEKYRNEKDNWERTFIITDPELNITLEFSTELYDSELNIGDLQLIKGNCPISRAWVNFIELEDMWSNIVEASSEWVEIQRNFGQWVESIPSELYDRVMYG